MIYYNIPYSVEKNLAKAYNSAMEVLPNDDDYTCFVDGDTIFTTSDYGHTIHNATMAYPNVGCFTCYTNRVYNRTQVVEGIDYDSNDVIYHRKIGSMMQTISQTMNNRIVAQKQMYSDELPTVSQTRLQLNQIRRVPRQNTFE